jgi:aspartyl protease family protein
MATGRMTRSFGILQSLYLKGALLILGMCSGWAGATEVGLAGIIGDKAILVIDGGPPRTLSPGQAYGSVKLLSTQETGITIMVDGERRSIRLGQDAVSGAPGNGPATVVLSPDAHGQFWTTGLINGKPVRFLVDTGAAQVSLGASDAKRLGLDLSKAPKIKTKFVNGIVVVHLVKLDTVSVGDIVMYNVDGWVNPTEDMPFALLGMSFLNRVSMQRDGKNLTLKKRF